MQDPKEAYRRQMVGRLQIWENQLIHLRIGIKELEGGARTRCDAWLQKLEAGHRDVVNFYAEMLAADSQNWKDKREALERAADKMELLLMDFAITAI